MQTFIDLITATFAAGETKVFEMSGSYFELIDAPSPVTVELSDRYGALAGKMKNAEASFFMASDYSRITLTSATAQTIRFGYGSGNVGNRKTAGVVTVVNVNNDIVLSQQAYNFAHRSPANATNYSQCCIFNPVGSTTNTYVERCTLSSTTTGLYYLGVSGDLTQNVIGNFYNNIIGLNKQPNLRQGITTQIVIPASPTLKQIYLPANSTYEFTFEKPLILQPGKGITVCASVVNCEVAANWQFYEKTI